MAIIIAFFVKFLWTMRTLIGSFIFMLFMNVFLVFIQVFLRGKVFKTRFTLKPGIVRTWSLMLTLFVLGFEGFQAIRTLVWARFSMFG